MLSINSNNLILLIDRSYAFFTQHNIMPLYKLEIKAVSDILNYEWFENELDTHFSKSNINFVLLE